MFTSSQYTNLSLIQFLCTCTFALLWPFVYKVTLSSHICLLLRLSVADPVAEDAALSLHHAVAGAGVESAGERLLLHIPSTQLSQDGLQQLSWHQLQQVVEITNDISTETPLAEWLSMTRLLNK